MMTAYALPSCITIAARSRLLIPTTLTLSACTTRSVMNFNRFDGRADAGAAAQFQQDDAICKGEVAKAQAMAAPIYMGRSLPDVMEAGMIEGQRNNSLRQIMVGCMAQRGYAMTMMTVPN